MAFTVTLAELSIFIIAISFLVLVVSVIPVLIQWRQTGKALQELAESGKKVCEDVGEITKEAKGQAAEIGEVLREVREVGLEATGIVRTLLNAVKGPAVALAGIIAGITFGLKHYRKDGDEDVGES